MSLTTIPLQAKQTITSATASTGVDISNSTYDFPTGIALTPVFYVKVYGLDAGDVAIITLESSTNSFSNFITNASWTAVGIIGATSDQGDTGASEGLSTAFPVNPVTFSIHGRDVNGLPWGESGGVVRVHVTSLTGSSPHLTYESWFTVSYCSDGTI